MRTSRSTLFLLICFLYLCCFVQQCHLFAFGMMASMVNNGIANAITMSAGMFIHVVGSGLQGIASAVGHGFMTLHTMTTSLVSGFMVGNLALAGFILFLLAVVPAEEEERRSLGANFLFTPLLPYHNSTRHRGIPLLPYHNLTDHRGISLNLTENVNSTLSRNKRATLVNNATNFNVIRKNTATSGDKFTLPPSVVEELSSTDRIPRFLTRLVQQDPLNCLPLLLCGLSASRKPSERTETLNDYAYLLKEFLKPDSAESAEYEDERSDEDVRRKKEKKNNRLRSSMALLNQLVQGGLEGKQKDEVDRLIDEMRKEEDERLEELALTEMAEDPSDLRFALEDMKVRGLKKTVSKLPTKNTKKKYLSQLMRDESLEGDEEYELIPDEEDPYVQQALMGRYERPQYTEHSSNMDRHRHDFDYNPYYNDPVRDLTRGAFPKPPPTPPIPEYGGSEEELYKRNLATLEKNLEHEMPRGYMGRTKAPARGSYPPQPPQMGQFRRRIGRDVRHAAPQRAFLQKKRGEAAEADNVFDKSRVATEVGAVTRNTRQCRALFNECPVQTIARPVAQVATQVASDTVGGTPFLNRAVNNIRRVFLGPQNGETSKSKRVNEIKEAIQQLNPGSGTGSEVKVVLNIGPSPLPLDHRAGGVPGGLPNYSPYQTAPVYNGMMYPQHNMALTSMQTHNMGMITPTQMTPLKSKSPPSPSPTGFSTNLKHVLAKKPNVLTTNGPQRTTAKPMSGTTKKTVMYRNPASSPASKKPLPPLSTSTAASVNLDDLEQLLKTTMPPTEDDNEPYTVNPVYEQSTAKFNTFGELVASVEQDEPSVEEDLVLPTKYPMTKDEYAQGLRETFQIFDRFKEAHKTPTVVTITRETVKPKPVATTRKPANKKKGGSKKSPPSKKKTGGQKGEQADLEVEEKDDGEEKDLGDLLNWFQKLTSGNKNKNKKKGKGKKGKGKKKGGDDSSEESSEEDHHPPRHPPLVAVPPPHLRQKIHWRGGTTLVKDGVYHFLFRKRLARPLPKIQTHDHSDSSESSEEHDDDEDDHDGKKPIRHDIHYYENPHHGHPQYHHQEDDHPEHDHLQNDHPGHDHLQNDYSQKDRPNHEQRPPNVYHRMKTSESVEDEIPPPPPIPRDDEIERQTEKSRDHPSSASESSSSLLIATRRPAKLKKPRPIARPEPDSSSYEDENEDDYHIRQHRPPLPPKHFQNYDSRSAENSDEEENQDKDDEFEVEPTSPQLVFSPFSIVRDGNKMKLKSKGGVTNGNKDRKTNSITASGKSDKKKRKQESKASADNSNNEQGNNALMKRTNTAETSVNAHSIKKSKKSATKSSVVMTKVKAMSTTTVKPKRKVLKYKNG